MSMKWGIMFNVPATIATALWGLPSPSSIERRRKWDGTEMIHISYYFQYSPQCWQEWQRIAAIKVQIQRKVKEVTFIEYVPMNIDGKIYTVSELGKYFNEFVKFPKPMYPGKKKEAYKMLCIHAKRLHYEGFLHVEQLIATSIRFNETDPEGITQTLKRADAAYRFAEAHKDEWKVKLKPKELHNVLSESAIKSANIRRRKRAQKKEHAKFLRDNGCIYKEIAKQLEVSVRTINRWFN